MAASSTETPTREEPHLVVPEGIVGSTAYGLAHDDSDVDRLGIFIEPTASFLGLDGVPMSKIRLDRFKPTSSGYRRREDLEAARG